MYMVEEFLQCKIQKTSTSLILPPSNGKLLTRMGTIFYYLTEYSLKISVEGHTAVLFKNYMIVFAGY